MTRYTAYMKGIVLWPLLAAVLAACSLSDPPTLGAPTGNAPDNNTPAATRPVADPADPPGVRTMPNPLCPLDYLGTTGQMQALPDPGLGFPTATTGGAAAAPAIAATLPDIVHLRDTQESYNATHYYAVREGDIYLKANRELTGTDEPWRQMLLPGCLQGRVSEVSVDGTVVMAVDNERWLYTLDTNNYGPMNTGWTRRWGAFFWTDPGEQMPADVSHWATSHLAGPDTTYIDSAGREQSVYGILTLYVLRGDELRITYMDPWLPSDESREVCGPERGTRTMAGLSGSGSTVMVVTRDGTIFTRLYEFDVSGANTVFFDYSWQDQEGVAAPMFQLPAPDWVQQPPVPGAISNRISLRKLPPDTVHRILRVEGRDGSDTGYWQKDLTDSAWSFVPTGEPWRGTPLPLPGPHAYPPEDSAYEGTIAGWSAEVLDFNPYCSPATLRVRIGQGAPTDFVLHSTDGLRQERRSRGLNAQPHVYRSAVEVPRALWNTLDQQPADVREFITTHFGAQRFLTGPLAATPATLQLNTPCWTLKRSGTEADALLPPVPPDFGSYIADLLAADEEGRMPNFCPP